MTDIDDETRGTDECEPIELEITDVLDLHTFAPSDVKALVREYLDLAYEKGIRRLRIIHGKGIGAQRRTVRTILERDPRVAAYGDPPGETGGWGATWVTLRQGQAVATTASHSERSARAESASDSWPRARSRLWAPGSGHRSRSSRK